MSDRVLALNPDLDFLIVIPTCADPAVLVPTFRRVVEHAEPRTRVVLSINARDAAAAQQAVDQCRALAGDAVWLSVVRAGEGPVGFARAVNEGLRHAEATGAFDPFGTPTGRASGLGKLNVVLNDDTRVTAGWLRGLQAAMDSPTVRIPAEPAVDQSGARADRDASVYGRIGIVGPVSDRVAGMQSVQVPRDIAAQVDAFSAQHRLRCAGEVLAADFLSGFCMALSHEALADLAEWGVKFDSFDSFEIVGAVAPADLSLDKFDDAVAAAQEANARPPDIAPAPLHRVWSLFDEVFGVGGYEDNDLCVRAELRGWRLAIAGDVFIHHVGHQTLDRYPGQLRGMANRLRYYSKWESDPRTSGKRLIGAYRVKLETVQDVHYLRNSIARLAELADGVAVLLTGNPLDIQASLDFSQARSLPASDQQMLQECSAQDAAGVAAAVGRWVERTWNSNAGRRLGSFRCEVYQGTFNERDERNVLLGMAEGLRADWILSVDHDEEVENRVDRSIFDRLMSHPDPLVRCWDFSWLNHWDSPRLVRQDRPWGDGGTYTGGMRGFRMFRVCKAAPRRILSGSEIGLHCGNVPMHDPLACRVSGVRFRHLGYLRSIDRVRKHARYTSIDPTPDAELTGGGYGHLVAEERMVLSNFVAQDGIGLSMLAHSGERVEDVARHLDILHGLIDRGVIVWTDPLPVDDPDGTNGVNPDVLHLASLHNVEVLNHPLDDDFAATRNAGLDYLRRWADADPQTGICPETGRPPALGWLWSVDPDEQMQDWFSDCVALRRMAECSDTYGWMVRFGNVRPQGSGEAPTLSETIRLIRMDPGGFMRWTNRVHEGFDKALNALLASGEQPRLRTCPFTVINPGLGGDDLALERKTRFYQRLLLLELEEDPDNAGAWVGLGMQYENDGHTEKAVACFQRAANCSGEGYLPYRELMLHHLRTAAVLAQRTAELVAPGHPYHEVARECSRWLATNAPPQPKIGLARRGAAPAGSDVPLPWHPVDGPRPVPSGPDDLATLLGPEWTFDYSAPHNCYTVALRGGELRTRVHAKFMQISAREAANGAIADALRTAADEGVTGEVVVEVSRSNEGVVTAVARPLFGVVEPAQPPAAE